MTVCRSFGLQGWSLLFVVHLVMGFAFFSFVFFVYFFLKRWLLHVLTRLIQRSKSQWDDYLLSSKVLQYVMFLIPGILAYVTLPLFFPDFPVFVSYAQRFSMVYTLVVALLTAQAVLSALALVLQQFKHNQKVAVNTVFQFLSLLLFVFGGIVVLAVFLNKSPWRFISGLGALTAVIMFVFKDTLSGFVSSLQLSINRMVQVGDWIEMPKYGADGDVVEVSLVSVKVQNWDKTISSIPTAALVNDSFKNWRGMSESGARRIKRCVYIDMASVSFCDAGLFERLSRIDLLRPFFEEQGIRGEHFPQDVEDTSLLNRLSLSNVYLFRMYLLFYLRQHPDLHQTMTLMVRQLQPQDKGLPLQWYVFSKEQDWVTYEDIQSEIMEHVLSVLSYFDLEVFQSPMGKDISTLALDS